MQNNLGHYRKSYESRELTEENADPNPMQQFRTWFCEADELESISEANAMAVATIGLDGFPKNRMVLLKHYDENGFVFYTNYNSEKGRAIIANPHVCLSFYWSQLERQIIIKGIAEKVNPAISDNYFSSRPKGSQLGAAVSPQSQVISRVDLENQLKDLEKNTKTPKFPAPKPGEDFWCVPFLWNFGKADPIAYTTDCGMFYKAIITGKWNAWPRKFCIDK